MQLLILELQKARKLDAIQKGVTLDWNDNFKITFFFAYGD